LSLDDPPEAQARHGQDQDDRGRRDQHETPEQAHAGQRVRRLGLAELAVT